MWETSVVSKKEAVYNCDVILGGERKRKDTDASALRTAIRC